MIMEFMENLYSLHMPCQSIDSNRSKVPWNKNMNVRTDVGYYHSVLSARLIFVPGMIFNVCHTFYFILILFKSKVKESIIYYLLMSIRKTVQISF